MASFLTVLFVICALVLFGVFFLIFKLVWLLCKQKSNFWPLVLSGCCTVILMIMSLVAVYRAYTHFTAPLQPIFAAVRAGQPITTRTYTDPEQNFSLVTYDGIVMSHWISLLPENQFLVGVNVNGLLQGKNTQTNQLGGLVINRQKQNKFSSASQFFREEFFPALQKNEKAAKSIEVLQEPLPLVVGTDSDAAYVRGLIHSDKTQTALPAIFLVALRGSDVYYLFGIGSDAVDDTVTSFHFLP